MKTMTWAGYVAHTGERRDACKVVVEKPEGKRQLWNNSA